MDSGPKQGEKYNCEVCGQPLTFIAAYNAWYCYVCRKYGTPKPVQQPQPPQYDFNAYQPPTTYVATQPETQPYQKPQVQPATQAQMQTPPQPQPQPQVQQPQYQKPTVYQPPQTQPQTQPNAPPYAPPQTYPQRQPSYGQQAYSGSYNSYGTEPARPQVQPPQVTPKTSDTRPQQLKCRECGMPLPPSGECPQCKAKELISLAEQMLGVATTAGIEVTKADRLIREAKTNLDEGNFGEARNSAEKAQTIIEELEDQHSKAKDQLADAQSVVGGIKRRGVDTGQADSLIQLAQSFMKTGNYEKSIAYARKAVKTANEAETRQATEKAIESRPQMPPAVARPVDTGDEEPPVPKPQPKLEPAPQPTQPAGPVECPSCGETVEAGWKRCPSCTAPLVSALPTPPKERQPPPDMSGEIKVPSKPEPKEPAKFPPKEASAEVKAPPKPEPKSPLKVPPKEPEPEEKKDPEYAAVEKEIKTVESELESLEKKGENVAHARNLLKLAFSFLRGGSYEKATRYARKVKNVLDEKKDE